MVSRELIASLTNARRRMPPEAWRQLATELGDWQEEPTPASIQQATADILNRDAAWILSDAFTRNLSTNWCTIAAAMTVVDYFVGEKAASTEVIWTGPANGRFPVRRVDQVLYDLISNATHRIVLVTFAAHRVTHLSGLLEQAAKRGIELTLIVESEGESEGQLTTDAIAAFRHIPASLARIYYWPLKQRERNQAGRPGKLHVKCAIIDDVAVVGSANLTDDAFNRNMELGLIVREQATVFALAEHFKELINRRVLVPVKQTNQ